ERAVETVLGSYLEAVSVETIDSLADRLDSLQVGTVSFFAAGGATTSQAVDGGRLLARVRGPAAISAMLSGIIAVDNLAEALARRPTLLSGESVITRDGIWIGRDWLRVSRDKDVHAGVISREQEMRELREAVAAAEQRRDELVAQAADARAQLASLEARRDALQAESNRLHRAHSDLNAQVGSLQAQSEPNASRVRKIAEESAAHDRDTPA